MRDAYARGVRQYLILGAGFDTFAYRNPYPDLRVFEIDHPDTQAVKRSRLAHAGIAIPPALTMVAADLAQASLGDELSAAGFDMVRPCSWRGSACRCTSRRGRRQHAALHRIASGGDMSRARLRSAACLAWLDRTRAVPRDAAAPRAHRRAVEGVLHPGDACGADEGRGAHGGRRSRPDEINARYFSGRRDRLKVSLAGRIARACVEYRATAAGSSR